MDLISIDSEIPPDWENETDYPAEELFRDYFAGHADRITRDYITGKTQGVINQPQSLDGLSNKAREEVVAIIPPGVSGYTDMSGGINYSDKDKIICMIKASIKTFDVKADLEFNDTCLVGKLINILGTEEDTETFISSLSMLFAGKCLSIQLGGEELVETF